MKIKSCFTTVGLPKFEATRSCPKVVCLFSGHLSFLTAPCKTKGRVGSFQIHQPCACVLPPTMKLSFVDLVFYMLDV